MEKLPSREIVSIAVDKLNSDERAAAKKILTLIEDYTNYLDLEQEVKEHLRLNILGQLAGLYNKFIGVISQFGPEYKFRRMERRMTVPPKASSSTGN